MATNFPIVVKKLANLAEPPFNLPEKSFRYNHLALESDQFICIRDVAPDGSNQVVVVDMYNDNAITRRPAKKADAALMHTRDKIIALRGKNEGTPGHFIQVYNLETKSKLVEHQFGEEIVFWKWVTDGILAIATTKVVWHCPIKGGETPVKMFDRAGRLAEADVQIINYSVDREVKWFLLAGISTQDKKTVDGSLQLYSSERQQQQLLEGHAGCFNTLVVDEAKPPIDVFSFVEKKNGQFKLHVMDIYAPRGQPPSFKVTADLSFSDTLDFPIFEHLSPRYGVLFVVSRGGTVLILEALSGNLLFQHKISSDTVFISCADSRTGGVIFANRKGVVFSATVNENALIPYIQQNLRHLPNANEIAISLVRRYGFPGADEILVQSFNSAFARADYKSAARIAASLKSGALRTQQTINQFKSVPPQPGQTSAILQYFSTLLEHGQLNALESMELVKPVVAQGRKEFVEKWLNEDKLHCTEELGDFVKTMDAGLALRIYEKGEVGPKVLQSYVERGLYDKIIAYAKKTNLKTDYSLYLRNMLNVNAEGAVSFANQLLNNVPPLVEVDQIVDVFVQQHRLQELTAILLDYLKDNLPQHAMLQTRLFELNLVNAPQVAEAIFQMNTFTHYDRQRIGQLCEKAGLYQRALEHTTDNSDIKRILSMQVTGQINADWLASYFGKLPPDTCLECLTDMLRANRQNLQVVVQVAIKYYETIGALRLVDMFESFGSWEGIFYFLGSILTLSTDPAVHFKYIEAASKLNHIQEVERACRESQYYDPIRVKDFLKQAKLLDPRPLIYVCDRHGFVTELAEYLYRNALLKFIEVYVVKVNPLRAPVVVGVLLDLDCSEDFIKSLLQNVRGNCPVQELVEEVEKRNRLRLILSWLEARVTEGNQDAYLHNALAKIYIDTNRDPEGFLKTNAFYDSKVVGKYCEERDPHLAFTAYKKNWGQCDAELIDLTNRNCLFRLQARYLIERQSSELWAVVLSPENEWRQLVVDQVVASGLPESTNPDEVSTTVKSFMAANLNNELMELLEKIVLHNTDFSQNKNLQNLLILTAIKSDPSRVMDYVNRLEHYDAPEIAQVAIGPDYKLYEEAVVIYCKCGMDDEAIAVIIDKIGSIDRAVEFAARTEKPSVWARLGRAHLQAGAVCEAIEDFLRAADPSEYKAVIRETEKQGEWQHLIRYLNMARKMLPVKDVVIDDQLVYSLAMSSRLSDMQEFVSGSNSANIQHVGDRLATEEKYEAAKTLYATIPNYSKLASCHLALNEYVQAIDAAKKAGSPKTWKEVNIACVKARDFRSAHIAGLSIVGHPDHLEELIMNYERRGHFDELISLLEAGVNNEAAPMALYTELAVVYAKYRPQKLAEFIRTANIISGRLNIPKLIRACERHHLWQDAVFLHVTYQEYDQAANLMIAHMICWTHTEFVSIIQKVANAEIYYRALAFYLDFIPLEINHLLTAISAKIDHARVVQQFRKCGHTALIQPYLEQLQQQQMDVTIVNTALNSLYLESENVEALKKSVLQSPNFDQMALADQMRHHELRELRRLACVIYRANHRIPESIELAKEVECYHEAMEAAKLSGSSDIAEDLLRFFVSKNDKESFAACLFICYELLRPDVVLELAWKTQHTDQVIPYMIQTFRDHSTRLDALEKKLGRQQSDAEREQSAPNDYVPDYVLPTAGLGHLALMPPPTLNTASTVGSHTSPYASLSGINMSTSACTPAPSGGPSMFTAGLI